MILSLGIALAGAFSSGEQAPAGIGIAFAILIYVGAAAIRLVGR
jgi:hypothetical protein